MASIEFVLVLPLLLTLVATIFWVASACLARASASVSARASAWGARFEDRSAKPFDFEVSGELRRTVTRREFYRPRFLASSASGARGSHMVLAGTWDHNEVPLNRPPNWDLAEEMISRLPAQMSGDAVATLKEFRQRLNVSEVVDTTVKPLLEQEFAGPLEQYREWWDQINNARSSLKQQARQQGQAGLETLPGKIQQHQKNIDDLSAKLPALEKKEQLLQSELRTGRDAMSGEKLDGKEIENREKQMEMTRQSLKDIRSKIDQEKGEEESDKKSLEQVKNLGSLLGE